MADRLKKWLFAEKSSPFECYAAYLMKHEGFSCFYFWSFFGVSTKSCVWKDFQRGR
jgi:hypothetical protein